jgi:hypothetical protein
LVRVHDLRHSFGCRLHAVGVSAEDREALLGHANHSMDGHYASADVGRLLKHANLLLDRSGTRALLRVADSQRGCMDKSSHSKQRGPGFAGQVLEFCCVRADLWIRGPTTVPQHEGGLGFRCRVPLKSGAPGESSSGNPSSVRPAALAEPALESCPIRLPV